jgi:hypothetical protein
MSHAWPQLRVRRADAGCESFILWRSPPVRNAVGSLGASIVVRQFVADRIFGDRIRLWGKAALRGGCAANVPIALGCQLSAIGCRPDQAASFWPTADGSEPTAAPGARYISFAAVAHQFVIGQGFRGRIDRASAAPEAIAVRHGPCPKTCRSGLRPRLRFAMPQHLVVEREIGVGDAPYKRIPGQGRA